MEGIHDDFETLQLVNNVLKEFRNVEIYPFNCAYWDMVDLTCTSSNFTKNTLLNLENTDEDTSALQNFVYYCTAIYNSAYVENDVTQARNIFEKYVQCYQNVCEDDVMSKYKVAFRHIFLTLKALLEYYYEQDSFQLCNILHEIPKFETMDNANKAAIFGTKAAILFEYGPFDTSLKGSELARLAMNLDPEQGEWYFLNGKGLHRNRRAFRSKFSIMPTKEEMKSLEQAVKLSPTPSKLVFLAECYVDALKVLYENENRSTAEEQLYNDMGLATLELFRRASSQKSNTPWYIFLRCGMGYLRITPPFNNYELAKDYFKLADALKPGSGFINHQLCTVYQKMKDYNNAFKFAKSASDYGIKWAALDEIRLGCIISRNHDVLHSLDRNFDKFSNYGKSILLLQKGSYLLIEKKKISEGLHYCFEGLKLNEHLSFVQNYSLTFNIALGSFSLVEYLHCLLHAIQSDNIKTSINITELIQFLQYKFPQLVGKKPNSKIESLVDQTLWRTRNYFDNCVY